MAEIVKKGWNDPVLTIVRHLPTGDVARPLTKKGALIFVGLVIFILFYISIVSGNGLERVQEKRNLDEIRPEMTRLANAGKDDAAIWLAKHYFSEEKGRLPALVEKGVPEAMYMQGAADIYFKQNTDEGKRLIERAAAAGSADAIRYLSSKN